MQTMNDLTARAARNTVALPLGAIVGYVLTRTFGLPGASDDIGNWGEPLAMASLFVEGALVALAGTILLARAGVSSRFQARRVVRHWLSDDDPAWRAAAERLRRSIARLERDGVDANGYVGDADPLLAIDDALRVFARASGSRSCTSSWRRPDATSTSPTRTGRRVAALLAF